MLPWVALGNLHSTSGASVGWGIATLLGGLGAVAVAVQLITGRLTRRSTHKAFAITALVLGVLSFAIPIYFVWISFVTEDESESDSAAQQALEHERSLEEFKFRPGVGIYGTGLGGLAVAWGGAMNGRIAGQQYRSGKADRSRICYRRSGPLEERLPAELRRSFGYRYELELADIPRIDRARNPNKHVDHVASGST